MLSTQKLFKLLFLLTTVFFALSPLGLSVTNYVLRIPALIIIIVLISRKYLYIRKNFFLQLLTLTTVFFVHLLWDTPFSIDIFLSCFSVIAYLLLIIISDKVYLDSKTFKFINFCSIIAAISLIGYSVSPISHNAFFEGRAYQSPYLTYGFDNSNYAGIVTLLVYSLIFITIETAGKITRYLCYVLEVMLFYCMYETNTRSVIAVALIIPFLSIIFKKIKFRNWMLALICLIPFLFVPFYMYLAEMGNVEGVQFMGKGVMSGRQVVYQAYFDRMHDSFHWIFGNLAENKLMNAHNGPLAILASCGILGLISYFTIFLYKLFTANKCASSHLNTASVFIIAVCFLNTCGEAALLLGGFPAITYLFTFFVFAYSKK